LSSVWTWYEGIVSLSSVWRGAEEECLYVFGLDISVTGVSLCLRSGRGARGMSMSSVWTSCENNAFLSKVRT
jgi:hypothetical protein